MSEYKRKYRELDDSVKMKISQSLKGKKKSAKITFPRHVAMYLSRMLTDESFPRIGLEFGGRDHSTVIHSINKIDSELKTNLELKKAIDDIKNML